MTQVGLSPREGHIVACVARIRQPTQGNVLEVDIIDRDPENGTPPQLVLPREQDIRANVVQACQQLNSALRESYHFAQDERHNTLDKDVNNVNMYGTETDQLQKAARELLQYCKYIRSVKTQVKCFIDDFINC